MPGFFHDTHITQDEFAWINSFFYLGYLIMQVPNSVALQKLPVSKYCGTILLLWGGTLFATAFATSFGHLVGLRLLLGFFEAITYPAIYLLIATIYRRSEQVFFFGIMFMSNSIASMVSSFIGLGILKIPNTGGFAPWQWSFLIYGMITMAFSFVYFFFLPDRSTSRWFNLTEEEKLIVEQRTRDNAVVRVRKVKYEQFWESLKEPRFYCYCFISLLVNLQNGALTAFSGIIAKQMGFTTVQAMLLTTPGGFLVIFLLGGSAYLSKKYNEIIYFALFNLSLSTTGLICLIAIPSGGVKLIGLYLAFAYTPAYTLLQTSISSNVSGYTKKIFYTSGNLVFYTIGNFVGPLLLRQKDAPRYIPGMGVYVAANVISILLFIYVRWTYVRENKRRNLDKNTNVVALQGDIQDITDRQNPDFVYRP